MAAAGAWPEEMTNNRNANVKVDLKDWETDKMSDLRPWKRSMVKLISAKFRAETGYKLGFHVQESERGGYWGRGGGYWSAGEHISHFSYPISASQIGIYQTTEIRRTIPFKKPWNGKNQSSIDWSTAQVCGIQVGRARRGLWTKGIKETRLGKLGRKEMLAVKREGRQKEKVLIHQSGPNLILSLSMPADVHGRESPWPQ